MQRDFADGARIQINFNPNSGNTNFKIPGGTQWQQ